jgi:hypothetical protein
LEAVDCGKRDRGGLSEDIRVLCLFLSLMELDHFLGARRDCGRLLGSQAVFTPDKNPSIIELLPIVSSIVS